MFQILIDNDNQGTVFKVCPFTITSVMLDHPGLTKGHKHDYCHICANLQLKMELLIISD